MNKHERLQHCMSNKYADVSLSIFISILHYSSIIYQDMSLPPALEDGIPPAWEKTESEETREHQQTIQRSPSIEWWIKHIKTISWIHVLITGKIIIHMHESMHHLSVVFIMFWNFANYEIATRTFLLRVRSLVCRCFASRSWRSS